MSVQLKGRNNDVAEVTSDGRLHTESESAPGSHQASKYNSLAFSITSFDTTAAGEYMLYFQNNNDTQKFFVEKIIVGAAETVLWKFHQVTGTAAGGAAVTPVCLNRDRVKSISATARGTGSITGLTSTGVLGSVRNVVTGIGEVDFGGALILGDGQAIAVEYDTGTTGLCEAMIIGYYE